MTLSSVVSFPRAGIEIGLLQIATRVVFHHLQVDGKTLAPQHPRYSTPAFQTTSHVIEAIEEHPWVVVLGPGVPAISWPNWDFGKSAGKDQLDVARTIYIRESILAEFQLL